MRRLGLREFRAPPLSSSTQTVFTFSLDFQPLTAIDRGHALVQLGMIQGQAIGVDAAHEPIYSGANENGEGMEPRKFAQCFRDISPTNASVAHESTVAEVSVASIRVAEGNERGKNAARRRAEFSPEAAVNHNFQIKARCAHAIRFRFRARADWSPRPHVRDSKSRRDPFDG